MVLRRALACCGVVMFCLGTVVGCAPAVDSSPSSPASYDSSSGACCGQASPGVTIAPDQASPAVTVPVDPPPPGVTAR